MKIGHNILLIPKGCTKGLLWRLPIIFIIGLYCIEQSNAQVSQVWVARYNFYIDDEAAVIAVDNTGNVYVTGSSDGSSGYPDYATIKYNSAGVLQWVSRYNGPGNDRDVATGIALDDSGNVYVTGTSNSLPFPETKYGVATIKYNNAGVQQWVRRYGVSGDDAATAGIVLDTQGNIYVGGGSAGIGYLIIKYNTNGDSLWVRTYNSGGNFAVAMAVDVSGNVHLTGALSNGRWGTVKWNSQGVFQWVQNGPPDYPKAIVVDTSGNVFVTGYTFRNNQNEYATVKYNSAGTQQWIAYYNGGVTYTGHAATSIIVDDSGNVYVTGESELVNFNSDIATIKYSSAGVQQWASRFNGPANANDGACCIKLDNERNVYVTGYTTVSTNNTDYCTIKYSNSGVQQWVMLYDGPNPQNPYDGATALALDQSGNVYVTGSSGGYGNQDYATIKYSQPIGIKQISNEIPKEYKLYQNYPNPFNPSTVISYQLVINSFVILKIYDLLGRDVATLVNEKLKAGTYEVNFNGENYPTGVYFYRLVVTPNIRWTPSEVEYNKTLKMILIK